MTAAFHTAEQLFLAQNLGGCIALCREILTEQPGLVAAQHLLAVALVRDGRAAEGAALLSRALRAEPAELLLRMDCALAFASLGEIDRAVIILAEGARHHAGNPDLAARLARLLSDHGRHAEAQAVLRAALAARPDHLELRGLLAAELAADLAIVPALEQMRLMQAILPGQGPLYANEGVLRQSLGDLSGAISAYDRAVRLDPLNHVAQVNYGTALMTKGDYRLGFARYEHRLFLPDMRLPPSGLPRWQGETLAGKRLLVSAEQGFGDLLQFIRFLPLLKRFGGEIWLDCPNEMKRLMASLPGVAGTVSPGEKAPPFDFAIPLLSLPWLLGSGDALASELIPYIHAPDIYAAGEGPVLPADPRKKIGLVWSGRPAKGELFIRRTLARRSCKLAELEPLWSQDRFRWFSLQLGDPCGELAGTPISDLAPMISDFADTAALIGQLDLVISIDSAAAHLTAAMGRPLWLLLAPGQCDYRWNGVQGASPWYPDVRLFRAGVGGFSKLATEVASELFSF